MCFFSFAEGQSVSRTKPNFISRMAFSTWDNFICQLSLVFLMWVHCLAFSASMCCYVFAESRFQLKLVCFEGEKATIFFYYYLFCFVLFCSLFLFVCFFFQRIFSVSILLLHTHTNAKAAKNKIKMFVRYIRWRQCIKKIPPSLSTLQNEVTWSHSWSSVINITCRQEGKPVLASAGIYNTKS